MGEKKEEGRRTPPTPPKGGKEGRRTPPMGKRRKKEEGKSSPLAIDK